MEVACGEGPWASIEAGPYLLLLQVPDLLLRVHEVGAHVGGLLRSPKGKKRGQWRWAQETTQRVWRETA